MEYAAEAPSDTQTGLMRLVAVLQKPDIDMMKLRGCVITTGLPSSSFCAPALRSLVWKLLLGVLPPNRASWPAHLSAQRANYEEYVHSLIDEPELVTRLRYGVSSPGGGELGPVDRSPVTDHPLAPPSSPSKWRRYWNDAEIFDQVNKDVFRTRPEMGETFFAQSPRGDTVTTRGRCLTGGSLEDPGSPTSPRMHAFRIANIANPATHHDRLCRLLFVFSKLNFGYVQGMNEMIAVLYYTFYADEFEGRFVEADTFFAFTNLMAQQRDVFCPSMDECRSGMLGRMVIVKELLELGDPELSDHLEKIGMQTNYFALRWVMLLFSHDFELGIVQVLWDAILSDQSHTGVAGKSLLVHYICIALLVRVRTILREGDFADCMHLLQEYPPFVPGEVIKRALRMRKNVFSKSASGLSVGSDDGVKYITGDVSDDDGEVPGIKSSKQRHFPLAVVVSLVKRKLKPTKS
jgi:TBC1 domain family member 13